MLPGMNHAGLSVQPLAEEFPRTIGCDTDLDSVSTLKTQFCACLWRFHSSLFYRNTVFPKVWKTVILAVICRTQLREMLVVMNG